MKQNVGIAVESLTYLLQKQDIRKSCHAMNVVHLRGTVFVQWVGRWS